MCIIAVSYKNTNIPSKEVRRTMFRRNPDGAGFMYTYKGRVRIEKGFMTFDAMEKRLDEVSKEIDTYKTPMVFHYRITTHGGTNPSNTHPFPVTSNRHSLRELTIDTWMGCAHNGIISRIKPKKGFSDTQEYIVKRISHLKNGFLHNKKKLSLIKDETASKFAFLTSDGEIVTVGEFYDGDDGCMYSNYSFESYTFKPYIPLLKAEYPPYDPNTYKETLSPLEGCLVIDGYGELRDGEEFCKDNYGRMYEILLDGSLLLDPEARVISGSTTEAAKFIYDDWGFDEPIDDDWLDYMKYYNGQ